jgi:hypothetical protein
MLFSEANLIQPITILSAIKYFSVQTTSQTTRTTAATSSELTTTEKPTSFAQTTTLVGLFIFNEIIGTNSYGRNRPDSYVIPALFRC